MTINLHQKPPSSFAKIILFLILALCAAGLFSCISEKKRAKICATCMLKETVKDSVSVKDSVAKIPVIKSVTVTIHDTLKYSLPNPCADLCDSLGNLKAFKKEIKSDKGAKLQIYSQGNQIFFKDVIDSLKAELKIKDTLISHYHKTERFKTTVKEVPARCNREHLTKLDSFWIISGRILLLLLIIYLSWKFIKYYKKYHLPRI